MTYSYYEYTK